MTSSRVIKWLAGFGIVGALLTIVMIILMFISPDGSFGKYLDLAGTLFLIFVIIAIYHIHMKNSGTFGLVSFIICIIGTGLVIGVKWVHTFVVPALSVHAPEFVDQPPSLIIGGQMGSFAIFMIGWVLIGILVAKKGYLSKISGILLIIAPILDFIPIGYYVAQPLFAIAILWISFQLFKRNDIDNTQET
ncbi:hypothetical protein ACFFIX_15235 [Metabacillus herbersteinensis]|uniref:DUF308 domain-containing protein n=1 Tax=Metabacillus herbersteinensis TaxID=283816 RepID=A0ABV6GIP2_9BACI